MVHSFRRVAKWPLALLTLAGCQLLWAQGTFINGNFETGNLSGWTQGGGYWRGGWPLNPSSYLPGGPNYNAGAFVNTVVGPGPLRDRNTTDTFDTVYSGSKTARVNDANSNYSVSVISQTVTGYTASHIYFAWAAMLEASHGLTDSDNFTLQLQDVTTSETLYQVAYNSADAATAPLFRQSGRRGWFSTSWQVQALDVSRRAGHTFTLTLLAADCPYGGHAGYVYLDGFGAVTPPAGPAGEPLTVSGGGDLGTFAAGGTVSGSVAVSGGVPPYKWSWGGAAPAGFSLSGGTIVGPATQPGNFSAALVVEDSAGSSLGASVNWSVFGFAASVLPTGVQFSP